MTVYATTHFCNSEKLVVEFDERLDYGDEYLTIKDDQVSFTISGPAGTIAAFVSQVEAALAQKAEVPA